MTDWIKKALTRRVESKGTGRRQIIIVEPDARLVLLVKFSLGMTTSLCLLETVHLVFLKSWNSEVFAAITGLAGTVTGVLVGRHS